MSLFPAVIFAGRSGIGEDVWVEDITEDKKKIGRLFFLPLKYLSS